MDRGMSNTDGQSGDYTAAPTESLITTSLGYCCIWKFFQLFPSTQTISYRLGMAPRTIRKWKAISRERGCQNCTNCMKEIKLP